MPSSARIAGWAATLYAALAAIPLAASLLAERGVFDNETAWMGLLAVIPYLVTVGMLRIESPLRAYPWFHNFVGGYLVSIAIVYVITYGVAALIAALHSRVRK